jgi:hypothetical protein
VIEGPRDTTQTRRLGRVDRSHCALGSGQTDGQVIYRNQTPATEFAAAQIAAHNPTDNSVIVDNDAILLSLTVARRSAGLRVGGSRPSVRWLTE